MLIGIAFFRERERDRDRETERERQRERESGERERENALLLTVKKIYNFFLNGGPHH